MRESSEDRTWVKICGIRRPADLVVAAEEGADAVGLVFDKSSPRVITVSDARLLVSIAGSDVLCVGVFRGVGASSVAAVVDEVGLDAIQYYGDSDEFAAVRKALPHLRLAIYAVPAGGGSASRAAEKLLSVFDSPEIRPDAFLFDSSKPGSGKTWEWSSLAEYFGPLPFVLAGGLDEQNVGAAIAAVRPWGVDVSSSVESRPGIKDPDRIRKFISAVRRASSIKETSSARNARTARTGHDARDAHDGDDPSDARIRRSTRRVRIDGSC